MKQLLFLLLILSASLVFSGNPDSSPPVLSMWIKASDIVVGEAAFGAGSLFGLMIENHSSSPVRLASDSDTSATGSWWKFGVEGPMDSRCLELSESAAKIFVQRSPGWVPFLEIPPHSVRRLPIGPYDWFTSGFYTLNAEYNGTAAPEGCFKGMLKAKTKTFTIKEPTGVDLEIIQKWRQQNPDKPYCYFPRNMNPNIYKEEILISEFPGSSYAAWGVLGDFDNAQTWRKFDPYNILRNSHSRKGQDLIRGEERISVWENLIENRPDFPLMTDAKIKYCLALWAIDRRSECIEKLRVWAKDKDDDLSNWAKKYLVAAERLQKEGKK